MNGQRSIDRMLGAEALGPVAWLRSPDAIRARTEEVLEAGLRGELAHFEVRLDALPAIVETVVAITKRRFPTLELPHHGRFGPARAGGVDRVADFESRIAELDADERARARVELVVTSVLLDAGAGDRWVYREAGTDYVGGRSEGLAVASYHAFVEGLFSSREGALRADAEGLLALEARTVGRAMQASRENPLEGLEGRAELLARLGSALLASPRVFGQRDARIGGLWDHLLSHAKDGRIGARCVLQSLLEGLAPIWPGRIELGGVNLGDVWRHPAAGVGSHETPGLVPFHKLSQWLAYSLVEPLERSGLVVSGVGELTGLAEYRNGGLFVDEGALVPKHDAVTREAHEAGSELVVEWRALTLALLERVATAMREQLGRTRDDLPMSQILEGGTWLAGRESAKRRRPGGGPPIRIVSDGTVF